ncbi:hypothetical protein B0H14DRAFT_3135905 [Mycena olivaceomarginata]|nr:hypothetical protein B0H14DRAFT_3135905 [Mycena olivaceomarginata]
MSCQPSKMHSRMCNDLFDVWDSVKKREESGQFAPEWIEGLPVESNMQNLTSVFKIALPSRPRLSRERGSPIVLDCGRHAQSLPARVPQSTRTWYVCALADGSHYYSSQYDNAKNDVAAPFLCVSRRACSFYHGTRASILGTPYPTSLALPPLLPPMSYPGMNSERTRHGSTIHAPVPQSSSVRHSVDRALSPTSYSLSFHLRYHRRIAPWGSRLDLWAQMEPHPGVRLHVPGEGDPYEGIDVSLRRLLRMSWRASSYPAIASLDARIMSSARNLLAPCTGPNERLTAPGVQPHNLWFLYVQKAANEGFLHIYGFFKTRDSRCCGARISPKFCTFREHVGIVRIENRWDGGVWERSSHRWGCGKYSSSNTPRKPRKGLQRGAYSLDSKNGQKLGEKKILAAGLLERRDWENLVEKCHIKVNAILSHVNVAEMV